MWELRGAAPTMNRSRLFASAMRIGRDHIASTIYTIVFAYAGTALTLLLAVSLYDRSWLDLLGTEEIAEELVRSFASSIGLVLAVPATTAIAVAIVPGPPDPLGCEAAEPACNSPSGQLLQCSNAWQLTERLVTQSSGGGPHTQ